MSKLNKYNFTDTAQTEETQTRRRVFSKLTVTQLGKKFPAFYGTRRFITMFTRARHWSLS